MNLPRLLCAAAVVSLLLIAPANASNLFNNGSFTTNDFTGWTVTDAALTNLSVQSSPTPIGAPVGTEVARFGATGPGDDMISQTLTTVAGDSYQFSFVLELDYVCGTPPCTGSGDFNAVWNGSSVLANTGQEPDLNFDTYSFTVNASTTSTVVSFGSFNTQGFNYLTEIDAEDLGPSGAPEPATLALSLAGLLAVAMIGRVRKFVCVRI